MSGRNLTRQILSSDPSSPKASIFLRPMGVGGSDPPDDDLAADPAAASPAVFCSICLDPVKHGNGDRSTARLQCGHEFHLGQSPNPDLLVRFCWEFGVFGRIKIQSFLDFLFFLVLAEFVLHLLWVLAGCRFFVGC